MRGKRFENRQIVRRQRIIPAHAGQTDRPASSSTTRSDHPRACGANVSGFPSRDVNAGSSPRMRGKPMLAIVRHLRVRIIPAHAGQTSSLLLSILPTSDHPRACGANTAARPSPWSTCGSSPRMRGKPIINRVDGRSRRIIPAHAGQTSPSPTLGVPCPDHPRACGANMDGSYGAQCWDGSSPRMRGKLSAVFW